MSQWENSLGNKNLTFVEKFTVLNSKVEVTCRRRDRRSQTKTKRKLKFQNIKPEHTRMCRYLAMNEHWSNMSERNCNSVT